MQITNTQVCYTTNELARFAGIFLLCSGVLMHISLFKMNQQREIKIDKKKETAW